MRPRLFCAFVFALAFALLGADATPSYALGRLIRRGGGMMVCNVAQAQPTQATAENLVQTAAKRVLAPVRAESRSPVLVAKSRSGVDLSSLAALNGRHAAPAASAGSLVAGK